MKFSITIAGKEFSFGSSKTTLSPDMAAWVRAEDVDPQAPGAKLTSPYAQSAWVYIAISRIAEKLASIPFRISRLSERDARRVRALRTSTDGRHRNFCRRALGGNIIESGDVVDLFNNPHPRMGRQLFWEMVATWNCLRGEFFIMPLDSADQPVNLADRRPRIERLLTLPTELFWHIVQGYDLVAWRYTGSPLLTPVPSEILLPTEVIHSRMPNPYLFWRGMSPLLVAVTAAGSDFAAAQYAKGYWLNNADTGVIVTTDQSPTPEQRQAILAALRERKRKAGTADRPLFLWGGAKVEKPTLNGMETQFIANRQMNRQEIGAIFKVPESVMGFSQDKQSALTGGGQAIDAEQVQFAESTITPLCHQLESALDPVVKSFGPGLIGWFDVESLPIMQAARRQRLDTGIKAFGIGAAFNDINNLYDLGFPEYKWGNTSYLPFSIQPVGASEPLPDETLPEDNGDSENEKSNPIRRMLDLFSGATQNAKQELRSNAHALWLKHVASRRKTIKLFESRIGKVIFKFRSSTLEKLAEVHLEKDLQQRALVDIIFSASDFGAALGEELKNPILAALDLGGQELYKDELGIQDPWTMPPAKAQAYLATRTQPIMGVGGTIRDQLNTALQQGLQEGETYAQLAQRVKATFNTLTNGKPDGEGGLSTPEALRVARTEANTAYGYSRHEALKLAGIEFKSWLSAHGPNAREGHIEAELYYEREPIPVEDAFTVTSPNGWPEKLMFPGDGSLGASAGNIINCQCVQLAARKVSEDQEITTYHVFGLGELKFKKNRA